MVKKDAIKKGVKYGERRIEITVYTNFLKFMGMMCIMTSAFSFFYGGKEYFVTIITLIMIGLILIFSGQGWEIYDKAYFKKLKQEMGIDEERDQDYM